MPEEDAVSRRPAPNAPLSHVRAEQLLPALAHAKSLADDIVAAHRREQEVLHERLADAQRALAAILAEVRKDRPDLAWVRGVADDHANRLQNYLKHLGLPVDFRPA